MYKKGDIVLVKFANSSGRGNVQRPAIVVQNELIDTKLSQIVIALITTTMTRFADCPETRIEVLKSNTIYSETCLQQDSVIVLDNMQTTTLNLVNKKLGEFKYLKLLDQKLMKVFKIDEKENKKTISSRVVSKRKLFYRGV